MRIAVLAAVLIAFAAQAQIPYEARKGAEKRLEADPNILDRVDNFCVGLKIKDACLTPGSSLAGGGAGTCKRLFHHDHQAGVTTIDLTCVPDAKVVIMRDLPPGGFAFVDHARCAKMHNSNACAPLNPMPSDRFCRGRQRAANCTVELTNDGNIEQHEGVCTQTVEYEGYGFHRAKRDVIICLAQERFRRWYLPR
jgi:hypothetical protein